MTDTVGTGRCFECGNTLHYAAAEHFLEGRNHWSVEFACWSCGSGGLECGRDIPGPRVRALLIEQNGLWTATVHDTTVPGTSILRALRRAYNSSLTDAKHQSELLRGHGMTGTHGEMLRLAHFLEELGAPTTLTLAATPAHTAPETPPETPPAPLPKATDPDL